jgi:hypothetical protein
VGHHDIFGDGRAGSVGLAMGLARAFAATATIALRLSAAALITLACAPSGLSGVTLANAAHAAILLAACMLSSKVRSMNASRSASIGAETAVGRN